MSNIIFICEGISEKIFVENILQSYWDKKNLKIATDVILLGATNQKCNGTGGDVSFERLKNDLESTLQNDSISYITTIFDFYQLHGTWPGKTEYLPTMTSRQKVEIMEKRTKEELSIQLSFPAITERFFPYFMLLEYEGLVFTEPRAITAVTKARHATMELEKILNDFSGHPEDINTTKAPSARISAAKANYGKTSHAHRIVSKIGIDPIREKCPHFNDWLQILERL